jgi:hypothetical protein
MKKVTIGSIIFILLTLLMCSGSAEASKVLAAGQSITFIFNKLIYQSSASSQDLTEANVNFSGNLLDSGESIKMEVFNNLANPAIYTRIFDKPTNGFGTAFLQPPPQVIMGAVKLTMITGSVNLSLISMAITKDGSRFAQTIIPSTSLPLLLLLLD